MTLAAASPLPAKSFADDLLLAVKPGLACTRSLFRRTPRYVISDPSRASHAAVAPEIWSLLASLDGKTSLTQALQQLALAKRPVPNLPTLLPALARLRDLGLVDVVSGTFPIAPATKPAQALEAKLVYYRNEFLELMPVLPLADKAIGWLYSSFGFGLFIALALICSTQLIARWDSIESPFTWLRQVSASDALMMYLLTIAIKALHELSHAVAYRRMAAQEGLTVSSIRAGIAFMLFLPFPFTNCTGAWGIANKYRRATIGMAGMYMECWVAVAALLIWSVTSNPILAAVCMQTATVVGVSTLIFNFNPLARLDGYYVLTDLLERPNLQGQAIAAAMTQAQRLLRVHKPEQRPAKPETMLLAYWAGSTLYRVTIFSGMIWIALQVGLWLAAIVTVIATSLLIVRPGLNYIKMLMSHSADTSATRRKLIGIAAVLVFALAVLPLPSGMRAPAIAEYDGSAFVYAPRDAHVMRVAAQGASGVVAELDDPELPLMQRDLTARRAGAAVRYEKALAVSATSPRNVEIARAIAEEIAGLDRQLASLSAEAAKLTTSASATDWWDPLNLADSTGAWVSRDQSRPIGLMQARAPVQVRALVDELAATDLSPSSPVSVRIAGQAPVRGRINRIDARASAQLPNAALSRSAGGGIDLNPDDPTGRSTRLKYVSVWIDVPAPAQLRHGQRVDVRFSEGARPLLWQFANAIPALIQHQTKS